MASRTVLPALQRRWASRDMAAADEEAVASPEPPLPILLIGCGGHGAVVSASCAASSQVTVVGAFDDSFDESGAPAGGDGGGTEGPTEPDAVSGWELLPPVVACVPGPGGLKEACSSHGGRGCHVAIGDIDTRVAIVKANSDAPWVSVVDPTAVVRVSSASIGRGCYVGTLSVVHPFATLGEHVIVNTGAVVEHHCVVGAFSFIAPRAVLLGRARVGQRTFIGAGATILPKVVVGSGCIVGAGAVVLKDVPDNSTVVGVPAQSLTDRMLERY